MKSYILFLSASFEDHEDLEYFCLEHFVNVSDGGIKYVIQSIGICVLIFDSNKDKKTLIETLIETLAIEEIKFYFLFEKNKVFWTELPDTLKDIIFKPKKKTKTHGKLFITNLNGDLDLDEILEKISNLGINSLNEEEKIFLNEFGK